MSQVSNTLAIVNLTKNAMHIVKSEKIESLKLTNTLEKHLEAAGCATEQAIEEPGDMATLLAGEGETPNSVEDAFAEISTFTREIK